MTVIHRTQTSTTQTPNATMTTLASPTLGAATQALWRVDMRPGQSGPAHTFDAEQLWTVIEGAATIELGGAHHPIAAGDTVVMLAGVPRRVIADPEAGLVAIVTATAGARAILPDGTDRGVPAWIA
jgi:quercetin dioxygenase-like cupin family protein